MFDLEIFSKAAVSGVPIVALVVALVEWIKRMGVTGKGLNAASMAIGLVFGAGYMISQGALNANDPFTAWFGIVVYGLGLGLTASGIYDALKGIQQAQK